MKLPLLPKWLRYLLVIGAGCLIVIFSVYRLPNWVTELGPLGLFPIRQYLHLIAYAGFALILGYALVDIPRPDWQVLLIVFVLTFLLGLGMEAVQATLPHRHASLQDVIMNAAGAALAIGIWRVILRRVRLYRIKKLSELPA